MTRCRVSILKAEIEGQAMMKRTVEATTDEPVVSETALLSEAALAEDWDRPEEDAVWSHLQSTDCCIQPEFSRNTISGTIKL